MSNNGHPVCVNDYEKWSRKVLPKNAAGYYESGATDEQTLNDNKNAFKRWRFRPRVLRNVSEVDTSTSILGTSLPFPICVAPTAFNRLAHDGGEIAVAKAALKVGTGYTYSSFANVSMEEMAAEVPDVIRWCQMYSYKDKELSRQMVKRAENSGFRALVLTVDIPVLGARYADSRNHFSLPKHLGLRNFKIDFQKEYEKRIFIDKYTSLTEYIQNYLIDATPTWSDVDWLKSITKLPIIVKGIVTREMAVEAVEHKVDGILVSNHGARQLDGVPATIDILSEVVRAVNGRCEVYMDGGVRNGGDVTKAIALGARAVFVGRPILWGLACEGQNGVEKILTMLRDEFKQVIQLLGVCSIKELQDAKDMVVHENQVVSKL